MRRDHYNNRMRLLKRAALSLFSALVVIFAGGAGYYLLQPQVLYVVANTNLILLPTSVVLDGEKSSAGTPNAGSPATQTPTPFQPRPFTPTPSPTPSPTPTQTPSPTPTTTPSSTPTADALPFQAFIQGIYGYPQTYNLSCESRSAADLARFFGVHFTELEFLWALPKADNPDKGFVGNVTDPLGGLPPNGYGVHAEPVAALLQAFGLDARALRGMSYQALRAEVAAGRPVMVWAIRDLGAGTPVEYTSSDGETTIVARYEHTFIVIGYGKDTVTVLDNHLVYSVPVEQFLQSWGVLGNMAIVVDEG